MRPGDIILTGPSADTSKRAHLDLDRGRDSSDRRDPDGVLRSSGGSGRDLAQAHANPNPYADCHAHRYADPNADRDAHSYTDSHPNLHAHSYTRPYHGKVDARI
jgi:hypothetical protein